MTMLTAARRRQAQDLQSLLDGGRASSPAAAAELAPLVALATALSPADIAPRAEFRAALRDRLLTEAAAREPAPRAVVTVSRERVSAPRRLRQAVAAVAVASVVAGTGAAVASSRALPGDTLYGLKRQVENVQLALARGDVDRGRELLEQADARLGEAESLAAGEDSRTAATRARLADTLRAMDAAVAAGADDLVEAYRETGDEEPMQLLDRFVTEQQDRLDDLLALLDPALRAQVRALSARLAELGAQADGVLGGLVESSTVGGTLGGASGGTVAGTRGSTGGGSAGQDGPGTAGGSTVDDLAGTVGDTADGVTGTGSGTGTSGGGTGGDGGLLGGGSTATAPLPTIAPQPLPTVSVPLPLPTSSPLVTDPVGAVTSAVPLPTSSALPSVSVCVPIPGVVAC